MTSLSTSSPALKQQADRALANQDYRQAIALYEQIVESDDLGELTAPELRSAYWHLGLAHLLLEEEAEAQTVWFLAMSQAEDAELALLTEELVTVLDAEADRQFQAEAFSLTWAIRQHIRELMPDQATNLLKLILSAIRLGSYTVDCLTEWQVFEVLAATEPGTIEEALLLAAMTDALDADPDHELSLKLIEACHPHVSEFEAVHGLLAPLLLRLSYGIGNFGAAIAIVETLRKFSPDQPTILARLADFYQKVGRHADSLEAARRYREISESLPARIYSTNVLLKCLMMAGGFWDEVYQLMDDYEKLLQELVYTQDFYLEEASYSLFNSALVFAYLRNDLARNRQLQEGLVKRCHQDFNRYVAETTKQGGYHFQHRTFTPAKDRPLKVGYVSAFLKRHSVGWLARWVFQHHDREKIQIHAYLINLSENDPHTRIWYGNQAHKTHYLGIDCLEIGDCIHSDDLDILVDLDSLTLDTTSQVLSLKPAPVQVTWLGWDASGLPSVDYFIADPYVLPDNAQAHYTETLWRMPQTYLAVDGFEVHPPDLRRDHLGIPGDAVVFYSGQKGHKRHPDTVRLQLRILHEVPGSYFLIKGTEEEILRPFFEQVASEEGVSMDRLRFLPNTTYEEIHRANLALSDVVLDTYPYNGATTTLETLWMGIPLVTRVGEQFVSRNSYTMLMNVGVTEGIAWSAEEYVEWGIRLGRDEALRQRVAWKLRQSRHTSPLWNAKLFTQQLEDAYSQMWQRFLAQSV